MIELVEARDKRMIDGGGRWFGHFETPTILSKIGKKKRNEGVLLNTSVYGRKESEGKDYNEDTNFGKLSRIPHPKLQQFLAKYTPSRRIEEPLDFVVQQMREIEEEQLQDEDRC